MHHLDMLGTLDMGMVDMRRVIQDMEDIKLMVLMQAMEAMALLIMRTVTEDNMLNSQIMVRFKLLLSLNLSLGKMQ